MNPNARLSICFVGTCYDGFIEHLYRDLPELHRQSYQAQLDALLGTGFGDADFYSYPMTQAGWQATDLIANHSRLQQAWAAEHGFQGSLGAVLVEQVRRLQPDVVYLQNLALATPEMLTLLRPHTRLIAGQIASEVPGVAKLDGIDVLFSSFPHFVDRFRSAGLCAYYQPLAFAPRMLGLLGPREHKLDFTFVGGISGGHSKGTQLLAEVARGAPLELWGYGAQSLDADSPLRPRHHGEAWGLDMFRLLRASRITLNRHIDAADRFANNMRLFEATGCGALLITDYKDNLNELFEIGHEVLAYRSAGECVDLVNYYLAHPQEAETIARAGQARTLATHSYQRRMLHTAEVLERHLRQPETQAHFGQPGASSYGYRSLENPAQIGALTEAWKSPEIPARQRALVESQLAAMYKGQVQSIFQVLAQLLEHALPADGELLEIGCSSGYYYEILEYLLKRKLRFVGADYSQAFVRMATEMYPAARFVEADGAQLPFADKAFPCVISSCVLLHVINYREHIAEAARVAQSYIVAHRTPVCRQRPTQVLQKMAYGVETIELRFNEAELLDAFAHVGFVLDRAIEYEANPGADQFEVSYRFRAAGIARRELFA